MINRDFGVCYHSAHVSRLMRQLGWTVQKPITRASQRDEAQVAAWREDTWPVLSAKHMLRDAR